jgi:hypothetical protein
LREIAHAPQEAIGDARRAAAALRRSAARLGGELDAEDRAPSARGCHEILDRIGRQRSRCRSGRGTGADRQDPSRVVAPISVNGASLSGSTRAFGPVERQIDGGNPPSPSTGTPRPRDTRWISSMKDVAALELRQDADEIARASSAGPSCVQVRRLLREDAARLVLPQSRRTRQQHVGPAGSRRLSVGDRDAQFFSCRASGAGRRTRPKALRRRLFLELPRSGPAGPLADASSIANRKTESLSCIAG